MNNIIQEWITNKKILEVLFKYPNRDFTMNELSKVSGVPYATTWRFVQKANKAGVLLCKKVGHSSSCKLNQKSPFTSQIKMLLDIKSPQQAVLGEFLAKIKKLKDVEEVILFGSVARGVEKLGSDVDVAIIVNRKSQTLEKGIIDIIDVIAEKSKVVITPIVLKRGELEDNKQFKRELEKGEILYVRHKRS
jgi:predicted nucleotidyltransferase